MKKLICSGIIFYFFLIQSTLSSSGKLFAQDGLMDVQAAKIVFTTRVMGLVYNYSEIAHQGEVTVNQHFVGMFEQFEGINNREGLNVFLSDLIRPFMLNSSSSTDIHDGELQLPQIESGNQQDIPILPDFDWINSEWLSKTNQDLLKALIYSYRPFKRTDLQKKGKTVHHFDNYSILKGDSSAIFTLGMIHFWNKINDYFPYKGLMDENWNSILKQGHKRFYPIKSYKQYLDNVEFLATKLDDSHVVVNKKADFWANGFGYWYTYPIDVSLFGGQIIVTNKADRSAVNNIQIGDTDRKSVV